MGWNEQYDHLVHERYLQSAAEKFDPALAMVQHVNHATYHTLLGGQMVHDVRGSAVYAMALLDVGSADACVRAEAVLRAVLALQDRNPEARTYGIWPYFAEEPLDQMQTPDWNWADFIGECLVQVLGRHGDRLAAGLREECLGALGHACASIRRRDVQPSYTNICALGSYVTNMGAALLDDADLAAYALARLRNFAAVTEQRGSLAEFNSPTYNIVTIDALTALARDAASEQVRDLAAGLLRAVWRHVTDHWHPPTHQWAGPHSRSYRTNLRDNSHPQLVLQKATAGRLAFYTLDELPGSATVGLLPYAAFAPIRSEDLALPEPRQHVERFAVGAPESVPTVGTTWLGPRATLASCNRLDLWNQRRAVVAYWGPPAAGAHLWLRCLHDGRDFASAQCFAAQAGGRALVLVNFGTNGGDWHPSLDRIVDGRFRARDLRLRVELFGDAEAWPVEDDDQPGRPFSTPLLGGSLLTVWPLGGEFAARPIEVQVTATDDCAAIDLVWLAATEPEEVVWPAVVDGWAALALALDEAVAEAPVCRRDGDLVRLEWGQLWLVGRAVPAEIGVQQAAYQGYLAGEDA